MKNEIEATFLSVNKEFMRTKLNKEGFILEIPEYIMLRKTFDFSDSSSGHRKWGRVRQESDKITMTVKEMRGSGIKDTYEREIVVNNFNEACAFFVACGVKPTAFQENLREVWKKDDIEITLDTWPGLNTFIEIEGPSEEKVHKIAKNLGFNFEKAVFGSIDLIYEKELGIPAKTIISMPKISFDNPPKKRRRKSH
jgi:adenylate cyclase class 2